MDDKRQKLKQAWTMIMMISAFLHFVVSIEAEVWRDEFNDKELKDWIPMGQFLVWETQGGFLHVKQVKPLPPKMGPPLEALQLNVFPGPHQQLTITATNLKVIKSGGFGIALGKGFPEIPGAPFHYIFFTSRISARRFTGDGGSAPFVGMEPKHPGTIWDTMELKEMKLIFNSGRFQMFANGELRADFEDPHFDQIELIRFAMWGGELPGAEGWVDSFEIFSDSALSVEPKSKLTTSWGKMKGRPF